MDDSNDVVFDSTYGLTSLVRMLPPEKIEEVMSDSDIEKHRRHLRPLYREVNRSQRDIHEILRKQDVGLDELKQAMNDNLAAWSKARQHTDIILAEMLLEFTHLERAQLIDDARTARAELRKQSRSREREEEPEVQE